MKKLCNILAMSVCMVLLAVSMAMAVGVSTEAEFYDAIAAGGEVTLTADLQLTGTGVIAIDKDVTIDGGNFTIKGNNSDIGRRFEVTAGNVVFKNVTLTEFGEKVGTAASVITVPDGSEAKLTVDNVTISHYNRYAIDCRDGFFDIKNSTIDGSAVKEDGVAKFNGGLSLGKWDNITEGTITNCTITSQGSESKGWAADGIEVGTGTARLTIKDCKINNTENAITVARYMGPGFGGYTDLRSDTDVKVINCKIDNVFGALRIDEAHPKMPAVGAATVTITGGDYNGKIYIASLVEDKSGVDGKSKITIEGGNFAPKDKNEAIYILTNKDTIEHKNLITIKNANVKGGIKTCQRIDDKAVEINAPEAISVTGGIFDSDPSRYISTKEYKIAWPIPNDTSYKVYDIPKSFEISKEKITLKVGQTVYWQGTYLPVAGDYPPEYGIFTKPYPAGENAFDYIKVDYDSKITGLKVGKTRLGVVFNNLGRDPSVNHEVEVEVISGDVTPEEKPAEFPEAKLPEGTEPEVADGLAAVASSVHTNPGSVALNTGIAEEHFEKTPAGEVVVAKAKAEELAKKAVAAEEVGSVHPLPVFTTADLSEAEKVKTAMISIKVSGKYFGKVLPKDAKIVKILGADNSALFTYADTLTAEGMDKKFTIQDAAGAIVTAELEETVDYCLTLFIKDGSGFDLNPAAGKITDPVVVVRKADKPEPAGSSGTGGCSAGFAGIALLALVPFILKRKD